jgi:hypothetical protein
MRTNGLALGAGSSALLLCLLATASPAQDKTRQRAPIVRVYSNEGTGVVSNYVTPSIQVSEDAYVFAVMMDLDGHIQVLQPDFPGISVRLRANKQLRLPNFFAGFNSPSQRYGMASYNGSSNLGNDARGTVIALASRAPFNLELIEADGDWNLAAIRQLIENRTPEGAAMALAKYLGAKGEPIGRDYMRFAGQRQSYYAYNGYGDQSYCGFGSYGYTSLGGGYYRADAYSRIAQLRAVGLQPYIAGYDACGTPIVIVAPFNQGTRFPVPVTPRPHGDTTVFPKSHFPQGFPKRPPVNADMAPVGIFPYTHRAELPQAGDVTITAPKGRRAEPREILDQYRPQPGVTALPERGRIPVERANPSEPATMRPIFRSDPLVSAPTEPMRAPERVREPAPAPIVHERPVMQPAPPPRAEAPSPKEPITPAPPR